MQTLNNTFTNIRGQIRTEAVELITKNLHLIEQKVERKNALRKLVEDTLNPKYGKTTGANVWTWAVKCLTQANVITKPQNDTTANWSLVEQELTTDKWAIIDKNTREVVAYVPSKNKGYEQKTTEQTVVKSETLV